MIMIYTFTELLDWTLSLCSIALQNLYLLKKYRKVLQWGAHSTFLHVVQFKDNTYVQTHTHTHTHTHKHMHRKKCCGYQSWSVFGRPSTSHLGARNSLWTKHMDDICSPYVVIARETCISIACLHSKLLPFWLNTNYAFNPCGSVICIQTKAAFCVSLVDFIVLCCIFLLHCIY